MGKQRSKNRSRVGVESIAMHLRRLRLASYSDYLASEHWRQFRAEYYHSATCQNIKARFGEYRCEFCFTCGPLNLHHMTYERLGKELPSDVVLVCSSCHLAIHDYYNSTRATLFEATHFVQQSKPANSTSPRSTNYFQTPENKALTDYYYHSNLIGHENKTTSLL